METGPEDVCLPRGLFPPLACFPYELLFIIKSAMSKSFRWSKKAILHSRRGAQGNARSTSVTEQGMLSVEHLKTL